MSCLWRQAGSIPQGLATLTLLHLQLFTRHSTISLILFCLHRWAAAACNVCVTVQSY